MGWNSVHWAAAGLLVLTSCSSTISDAAGLRTALADAGSGDVIVIGSGAFEGPFDVPPGVTVQGQGVGLTTIVAPVELTAITLQPGSTQPTSLRLMTVIAAGRWAVSSRGPGAATLEDVELSVPARGAAFGAQGLTALTLTRVRAAGPVQPSDARSLSPTPSTADTGTHGIDLVDVAGAVFNDVDITGFAVVGSLMVRSNTVWQGGSVRETAGVGIYALGGTLAMMGTEVRDVFPATSVHRSFGVMALGAAEFNTVDLAVRDTGGPGVFLDGVTGQHTRLELTGNRHTGIWMQAVTDFSASDMVANGNSLAGVVLHSSRNVTFDGLTIGDTGTVPTTDATGADINVGDGMQIVGSLTDLRVQNASVTNSGRVGLLVHTTVGDLSTTTLDSIVVDGSGEQLGAIMQGASVPGWDDGIERRGGTSANDEALTVTLDVVGIVAPVELPLGELGEAGIDQIVAPVE